MLIRTYAKQNLLLDDYVREIRPIEELVLHCFHILSIKYICRIDHSIVQLIKFRPQKGRYVEVFVIF